ncbi:MAG: hypothetical protein M3O88_03530 [Actinomycetota bacterium]|nr:hypothetical protein [Actinomycetota bacterium]
MTTPLVLLGLALLAGAVVWVLSVRQPGSTSRPSTSGSDSGFGPGSPSSSAAQEPGPEPTEAMDLGTPGPAPGAAPAQAPSLVGRATDSFAYLPLELSDGLNFKTRLLGVLGLIAVILLTSAVVALGLWMLGRGIRLEFAHLAGN